MSCRLTITYFLSFLKETLSLSIFLILRNKSNKKYVFNFFCIYLYDYVEITLMKLPLHLHIGHLFSNFSLQDKHTALCPHNVLICVLALVKQKSYLFMSPTNSALILKIFLQQLMKIF